MSAGTDVMFFEEIYADSVESSLTAKNLDLQIHKYYLQYLIPALILFALSGWCLLRQKSVMSYLKQEMNIRLVNNTSSNSVDLHFIDYKNNRKLMVENIRGLKTKNMELTFSEMFYYSTIFKMCAVDDPDQPEECLFILGKEHIYLGKKGVKLYSGQIIKWEPI